MSKKILFCSLFILIFLIPSKQDSNARTWKNCRVHAESIIAAIERGDTILIRACEIIDPLIKRGTWDKPDTIKSVIYVSYSTFLDEVDLSNCYFLYPVDFYYDSLSKHIDFFHTTFAENAVWWNTTFCHRATFMEATFYSSANFLGSTFDGDAIFGGTTFDSIVTFQGAIFSGFAEFRDATFGEYADFTSTTFDGLVEFLQASFDSSVCFKFATFGIYPIFYDANFGGYANFWRSTFDSSTNFSGVHFRDSTLFRQVTFRKGVSFGDAVFDSSSTFEDATFGGDADFSEATFNGDADFQWVTFEGDADFSGANFHKQVYLSPKEFMDITISWEQLEDHLVYNRLADYQLRRHFEEKTQFDDADRIYLFIKDQERMRKSPWVRYPEYWCIYLTCGYGTKPLNTFILSIVLVILFAVFFTNPKAIKEIEKESRHRKRRRSYRDAPKTRRKRFYYALYFSLHIFIIGVVSDWHASDEFLIGDSKKRGIKLFRFRTLSMIEGALGWILVIILIISLERTIGR
jgi:uncharacterized protein YjbI with pentapeptide repeats